MGATPPSLDLPGFRQLRDRADNALQRCQEVADIAFKESAPWENLKSKVVHVALGMGNLRDGGIVIIGVSERDNTWTCTGITEEHLATYDVDLVTDQTNSYVSPHVDLDIVVHEFEGRKFLVIRVHEFAEIPLVCKKNGPDGSGIVKGGVYIRLPGTASTTKIQSAEQMRDLLNLAGEKRAREILETAKRVGMAPTVGGDAAFDRELGGDL